MKMKKFLLIIAALSLIACTSGKAGKASGSLNDGFADSDAARNVYVLGFQQDTTYEWNDGEEYPEGKFDAVYWKNGTAALIADETGMPEGFDSFVARDMLITDGNRVFLGTASRKGLEETPYFFFNNGKFTRLKESESAAKMRLCYVGGKVKAVGSLERNGNEQGIESTPAIWDEEGNMTIMEMGSFTNCTLEDIVSDGNDIYACGRVYANDIWNGVAAIWKNGKLSTYNAPDGGITMFGFTAIGVSGNDVYTTMVSRESKETEDNSLTLWKNGKVETVLEKPNHVPMATCIAIDGKDIYVGGSADRRLEDDNNTVISMPRIWKNGKSMTLDSMNEMGLITSIAVENGSVYAVGDHAFAGALWTNGKMQLMSGASGEGTMNKVLIEH